MAQTQRTIPSLTQLASYLVGTFQPTSQNDVVTGREHEIMALTQFFATALTNDYLSAYYEALRRNTNISQSKSRIVRHEVQRLAQAPVQCAPITSQVLRIDPTVQTQEFLRQQAQDFYPHGQAMYLMGTPGIGKTLLTKFVSTQLGLDGSIPGLSPLDHNQHFIFLNANYTLNNGDIMADVMRKIKELDKKAGLQSFSERLTGIAATQLRQAVCNQRFFHITRNHAAHSMVSFQYFLYQRSHLDGLAFPSATPTPDHEPSPAAKGTGQEFGLAEDKAKGIGVAGAGELAALTGGRAAEGPGPETGKISRSDNPPATAEPVQFLLAPVSVQNSPYRINPTTQSFTTALMENGEQVQLTEGRKAHRASLASTFSPLSDSSRFLNTDSVLTFEHLVNKIDPCEEQLQLFELAAFTKNTHGLTADQCVSIPYPDAAQFKIRFHTTRRKSESLGSGSGSEEEEEEEAPLPAKRDRGRPPGPVSQPQPKSTPMRARRGAANVLSATDDDDDESGSSDSSEEERAPAAPVSRTRGTRAAAAPPVIEQLALATPPPQKRRGRPPKKVEVEKAQQSEHDDEEGGEGATEAEETPQLAPKRRGRPPKSSKPSIPAPAPIPRVSRRRGAGPQSSEEEQEAGTELEEQIERANPPAHPRLSIMSPVRRKSLQAAPTVQAAVAQDNEVREEPTRPSRTRRGVSNAANPSPITPPGSPLPAPSTRSTRTTKASAKPAEEPSPAAAEAAKAGQRRSARSRPHAPLPAPAVLPPPNVPNSDKGIASRGRKGSKAQRGEEMGLSSDEDDEPVAATQIPASPPTTPQPDPTAVRMVHVLAPTIAGDAPFGPNQNPFVSVTTEDVKRFETYTTQFLPQTPISNHFGLRFSHSASIILVIDEFDQLSEQHAAQLIRACYSPFSRLFLIGLGNKLNFMETVMNAAGRADDRDDCDDPALADLATAPDTESAQPQAKARGRGRNAQPTAVPLPLPSTQPATHPLLTKIPTDPSEVKFVFPVDPRNAIVELRPTIIPFRQYDFHGFAKVLQQRNFLAVKRILDWAVLHYHHNHYLPHLAARSKAPNPNKRPLAGSSQQDHSLFLSNRPSQFLHSQSQNDPLGSPPRSNYAFSAGHMDQLRKDLQQSPIKSRRPGYGSGLSALPRDSLVQLYSQADNADDANSVWAAQPDYPDLSPFVALAQSESFSPSCPKLAAALTQYSTLMFALAGLLAHPDAIRYCARAVSVLSSDVRSCLEIWKGKLELIGFFTIPTINSFVPGTPRKGQSTALTFTSPGKKDRALPLQMSPTRSFIVQQQQQAASSASSLAAANPFASTAHQLPFGSLGSGNGGDGIISMRDFMSSHGFSNLGPDPFASPTKSQSTSLTSGLSTPPGPAKPLMFHSSALPFPMSPLGPSQITQASQSTQTAGAPKHPRYPIIDLIHYIYQELDLPEPTINIVLQSLLPPDAKTHPPLQPTPITEPIASLKPHSILQGKSVETLLIEKTNDKLSKLTPIQLRVLCSLVLITLSLGENGFIELTQFAQLCDAALEKVHLPSVLEKHETLLNILTTLEIQHLVALVYTNSQKKRVMTGSKANQGVASYKYSQSFSIKCLLDPLQLSNFLKRQMDRNGSTVFQRTVIKIDKLHAATRADEST